MSKCTCSRENHGNDNLGKPTKPANPGETLPIEVGRKKPACLVPGASRLYCYWKITLRIDIAKKDIDLYVPPEWRALTPERLADWTGQLRDRPFEDIVLGRTQYHWTIDVLLPARQDYRTVPIHGRNGWPNFFEPTPIWNKPRLSYETERLAVTINRSPIPPCLGMENIVCYWRMRLPRTSQPRRYVWVPPEWRRLTDKTRSLWARRLGANPEQPIELGGTHYYWDCDTLVPYGQNPQSIEYEGCGRYKPFDEPCETDPPPRKPKFWIPPPPPARAAHNDERSSVPKDYTPPPREEVRSLPKITGRYLEPFDLRLGGVYMNPYRVLETHV